MGKVEGQPAELEDWMRGFARWIADRCARFDREEECFDELAVSMVVDGFDLGERQYFMECRVANLCDDWMCGGELDGVLEEAHRIFKEEHVPVLQAEAEAEVADLAAKGYWDAFRT